MPAGRLRHLLVAAAATLAMALALPGCLDGAGEPGAGEAVTVYVSLPLHGSSGRDGRDAADGARLAYAEAEGRAGTRRVRARFLDATEGRGAAASWSPARVGRNARRATRDASAIAYIGELEAGATRTSLPITNEARILQVSPGSAAEDLVREPGTFDGVPAEVQPSGERTFGRVIPSDVAQARAGARWAADLGPERATVIVERSEFGRTVARSFIESARIEDLEVERLGLDRFEEEIGDGVREPALGDLCALPPDRPGPRLRPGSAYFAGEDPRALALFGCLQPLASGSFVGTDALIPHVAELRGERLVNDVYLTSAAQDPVHLPPGGRDFVERFRREHGREPGRYAAYGYEAMAIVLDSIERAGDGGNDRSEVSEAFFATADRDSILGAYSIESTGETTLDRLTGYRVEPERVRPAAVLRSAGG